MANEQMTEEELLKALMKEFEMNNPSEIKNPTDFMNYERNMLSYVMNKARALTQMKIESLGTGYQGPIVKKKRN